MCVESSDEAPGTTVPAGRHAHGLDSAAGAVGAVGFFGGDQPHPHRRLGKSLTARGHIWPGASAQEGRRRNGDRLLRPRPGGIYRRLRRAPANLR